jgi:hypothetical protein
MIDARTPEDGGPAFPAVGGWGGMNLRDYFAAAALQGQLANSNAMQNLIKETGGGDAFTTKLSTACYKLADAMLKARSLPPS